MDILISETSQVLLAESEIGLRGGGVTQNGEFGVAIIGTQNTKNIVTQTGENSAFEGQNSKIFGTI